MIEDEGFIHCARSLPLSEQAIVVHNADVYTDHQMGRDVVWNGGTGALSTTTGGEVAHRVERPAIPILRSVMDCGRQTYRAVIRRVSAGSLRMEESPRA